MPHLLNKSSVLMCPHGGQVNIITSNTKSKAGGDFLVRSSDTFLIAGCALNISGTPHPCVEVQWVQTVAQSKSSGDFHLSEQSTGLCKAGDQAVQGTVMINTTQTQVSGR